MTTSAALALGWDDGFATAWRELGSPGTPGRVSRLDRGWSSVLVPGDADEIDGDRIERARNVGLEVAVGDWVVVSDDGERVEHVLPRRSAFVRRASFEGARAEPHAVAANIDTVFLCHSFGAPPNQRRLERELVLAFDSGADPAVVLTKADLVADAEPARRELQEVALGAPVVVTSGRTDEGISELDRFVAAGRTLAFLGASGVGKSTLVNALIGSDRQATTEVRTGDHRGRHTTVATELIAVPGRASVGDDVQRSLGDGLHPSVGDGLPKGWVIDTPGMRALSLWMSGDGIERAFSDVFDLMDRCRFRDCKHDREPGCAVREAIAEGRLDPERFANLERLVAEEAALEEEQRARDKAADRRRPPKLRRNVQPGTRRPPLDE